MKTKLFTQKSFLGILIALVLAFSVQGIADALTFGTTRTGDLKTYFPGEEFSITFSVKLTSSKDIYDTSTPKRQVFEHPSNTTDFTDYLIDSSGYKLQALVVEGTTKYYRKTSGTEIVDTSGYVIYTENTDKLINDGEGNLIHTVSKGDRDRDADGNLRKMEPDDPESDSLQHHYNDEAIAIVSTIPLKRNTTTLTSVTTRPGRLTGVAGTSGNIAYSLADETKNRDLPNDKTLSSSITLKGQAPSSVGEYVIEIVDVTHLEDFPANEQPSVQARQTFTIYVVPTDSNSAPTLSFASNRNSDYETGNDNADSRIDNKFGTGNAVFGPTVKNVTPLTYKVVGSGRLYVKETYDPVSGYETPLDSKSSTSQTITTSAHAEVWLDMNGSSNKVTAYVRDKNPNTTGKSLAFVFLFATIEVDHGNNQTGAPNAQLGNSLGVKVKDSKGRVLSGLAVKFTPSLPERLKPVPGTIVYVDSQGDWGGITTLDDTREARTNSPREADAGDAAWVQTDSNGIAKVYLRIGPGTSDVTLTATTLTPPGGEAPTNILYATRRGSVGIPSIEVVSGDKQKSDSNGNLSESLVVLVRDGHSNPYPDQRVTFTTTKGNLITDSGYQVFDDQDTVVTGGPALTVIANTDSHGQAAVTYQLGNYSGASTVTAEISNTTSVPTYQRRVTFNINGTGSSAPPADNNTATNPSNTSPATQFTVFPQSISGGVGSNQTLTITVPSGSTAHVGNIILGEFLNAGGSAEPNASSSTFQSILTLPSTAGTYNLVVSVGADRRTVPVTVSTTTTTTQKGTLRISDLPLSGAIGSQQVATVTATGSDGNPASGVVVRLSVTNGGGVFTPERVTTGTDGKATSTFTRGTTAGTDYFVEASATGYTSSPPSRIVITSATPTTGSTPTQTPTGSTPPQTTTTPTSTAGTPDLISIDGEANRTGTLNEELDAPLVVEVLDSKGTRVKNARVVFRVRKGQGRLSQLGNGRAYAARTDSRGNARANYTPMSASSTVEASVRGVSETVTFTITTDGSTPTTPTPTGDTPRRTIAPVVKVKAANRPPMLWVDGGAIYALVGEDVQAFAPSVDNALNVTLAGNKVYWTERTGDSAGTINSANLDGTQAKELKSIMAVPMGITVDTDAGKLYWTNSRGRIQSANLDGSGIQNVRTDLSGPMDIAVSRGNLYWTQYDASDSEGSVGIAKSTGRGTPKYISTGSDMPGSLVISGNKVYWTEMTGESAGTVNSANLNGNSATQLASIRAVPMGIAVDGSRSKLYWTNSRGRVQSANLNGSKIQNVVDGLGMPGDMVVSNSLKSPVATTPTKKSTTTASNKYDVNGDGSVDSKDVDTLLLAVLADLTADKYDVNGDGKVDAKDVRDVNKNLDDGAAGAPTLLGTKFSALEVNRLQAQIDLLVATGDRSPAALKTLIYLQQLLVMARPEKTQLLANYPNPFNPETWIPYELATDTDVTLTIYNAQGVVVRVLQLGQQSAGYYTDRERAAYWDGRNALGEQVASGIYFYQLETDDMSSLRKMVILK